jgi:CubicO group peptidase (beta-lactamase class C family)
VLYSNLGPGLLAVVVERLTHQTFQEALTRLVLSPLQIEGYLGSEPPRTPAVIAGKLGEQTGTSLEPYNTPFWRSLGLPWGGLVTNASGTLALVRAFAGILGGFLSTRLIFEATRDQTGGLGGGFFEPLWWPRSPWGLGAELRGDKSPHWTPPQASSESFGHAGASDCLVWHDPVADISWAILGAYTFESWWTQWHRIGAAIFL